MHDLAVGWRLFFFLGWLVMGLVTWAVMQSLLNLYFHPNTSEKSINEIRKNYSMLSRLTYTYPLKYNRKIFGIILIVIYNLHMSVVYLAALSFFVGIFIPSIIRFLCGCMILIMDVTVFFWVIERIGRFIERIRLQKK